MPPDPPQQQPPAPDPPPGPAAGQGGLEARVKGLEIEQQRQGGMLEQILNRLPGARQGGQGGGDPAPAPGGKSIGELVREGIEDLERDKAAKADADAAKAAREDHAARIKALEERAPKETAATPLGGLRAAVQRYGFGIDEPHR